MDFDLDALRFAESPYVEDITSIAICLNIPFKDTRKLIHDFLDVNKLSMPMIRKLKDYVLEFGKFPMDGEELLKFIKNIRRSETSSLTRGEALAIEIRDCLNELI